TVPALASVSGLLQVAALLGLFAPGSARHSHAFMPFSGGSRFELAPDPSR
nr:taurochenodeoxycholic acid 6-alpha-hydroxylase (EC 1.14.-.-) - guinea pig (fragments) [Cavia porcellus]